MPKRKDEIRKLPLFSDLSEEQLEKISAIVRVRALKRKQVLFREGDPVEGMFFVLDGRLKLYKLAPDGKEHILHVVSPGQGFAEAAVFMRGGYPAFAEALQASSVLCLPKAEFIGLMREEPDISLAIIATMSRYLKLFADRIEDLSLKDVSARFARWMLKLAEEKGCDFWDLEITKSELASQLGTVSETLSRTLRKFQDEGWIQVRGRFMKILDRNALMRAAAGEENGGI